MIRMEGSPSNRTSKLLCVDAQRSVVRRHSASMQSSCSYAVFGFEPARVHQSCTAHAVLAFNGQRKEATGLYLMGNGHRAYNSALMVFLSPDQLSPFEGGGINAYAYCGLDPVNWQDLTGRERAKVSRPPRLATIYDERFVPANDVIAVVSSVPSGALPKDLRALYQEVEALGGNRGTLQASINNSLNQAAEMSWWRGSRRANESENASSVVLPKMFSLSEIDSRIHALEVDITRWVNTRSPEDMETIQRRAQDLRKTFMSKHSEGWTFASLIRQSMSFFST
ncbi:hypothetical protein WR25_08905 [Diploscapter pachys]|uniref:RHS repeat-associated core domain-containing protein n=2 Tax=cellular organisms TaxID=131567 RepID=A0A2A2JXD5_9BILA|nr:hypothetical protein C3F42_28355 [Pseudomonas sp. PONIH3]PAV66338.1 hypothetical protein WR25_08905 [Diploscapter pachys]